MERLTCHITFLYREPRLDYLYQTIDGIKTIQNVKADIFVHSNHYFDIPRDNVQVIKEEVPEGEHPLYLGWLHRPMVKSQLNDYDLFMHIEDDMLFRDYNFKYWKENYKELYKHGYDVGFLRIETSSTDGKEYVTDLFRGERNSERVTVENKEYALYRRKYQGFWLYDKEIFSEFISIPNYLVYRDKHIMFEESSFGFIKGDNVLDPDNKSLIPLTNGKADERCRVYHLPNSYVDVPYTVHAKVLYDDAF